MTQNKPTCIQTCKFNKLITNKHTSNNRRNFHYLMKLASQDGKNKSIETLIHSTDDLSVIDQISNTHQITNHVYTHDTLITGSSDNTIYFFDRESGHTKGQFKGHQASITHLELFQQDSMLASVDASRIVNIWDLNTKELLYTLRGHQYKITSLTVSKTISRLFQNPKNLVRGLLSNVPRQDIQTGDERGNIIQWNTVTQSIQKKIIENGHSDEIIALIVDQYNDLYSASKDNTIKKWNRNGELIFTKQFESTILNMKLDAMHNQLFALLSDGQLMIFDTNYGVDNMSLKFQAHHGEMSFINVSRKSEGFKTKILKRFKKVGGLMGVLQVIQRLAGGL